MRAFLHALNEVLRSPTWWLILLVAVALGLLGDGASKLLDALAPDDPLQRASLSLAIGGGVLLLLGLAVVSLPRLRLIWRGVRGPALPPSFGEPVTPRRGVVVLVSRGDRPAAARTLDYHGYTGPARPRRKLTHAWLIAGPGDENLSSRSNAAQLHREWDAKGVVAKIVAIDDAYDAGEVYRKALVIFKQALQEYDLPPHELIVDYTGGTASMTAGLVLAAQQAEIDMQYLIPQSTDSRGQSDKGPSQPSLIRVHGEPAPRRPEQEA